MKLKNLALHFSGHCSVIGCFSVVVNVNQKMRCDKKKIYSCLNLLLSCPCHCCIYVIRPLRKRPSARSLTESNLFSLTRSCVIMRKVYNNKCFTVQEESYTSYVLGATRTKDVKELIHARQSVVVHAKAYGLQAIDMVYINFKGMSHTRVCDDVILEGSVVILYCFCWLL